MKRHRATRHTPVGRPAYLKIFTYLASAGLEIGPGQDLVVGDDV
jgi:hypothetical protein